jgi:hypothetical protein
MRRTRNNTYSNKRIQAKIVPNVPKTVVEEFVPIKFSVPNHVSIVDNPREIQKDFPGFKFDEKIFGVQICYLTSFENNLFNNFNMFAKHFPGSDVQITYASKNVLKILQPLVCNIKYYLCDTFEYIEDDDIFIWTKGKKFYDKKGNLARILA